MAEHGTFYWNELMTRDAEKAKAFYGGTLGWSFDAMPMEDGGTYWVAKVGDSPAAGIMTMSGPDFEGVEEQWFSYVAVDDVDAAAKQVADNGGSVGKGPFDVPGVGRIVILQDANGVHMGWMTPAADG